MQITPGLPSYKQCYYQCSRFVSCKQVGIRGSGVQETGYVAIYDGRVSDPAATTASDLIQLTVVHDR